MDDNEIEEVPVEDRVRKNALRRRSSMANSVRYNKTRSFVNK